MDIQSDFFYYFNGWTDQKISKQKFVFSSTEGGKREVGLEKGTKDNQIIKEQDNQGMTL